MASEDSIQKLVKDTQVYLAGVWDALGTADEERDGAVNKLFEDLEQVLMHARDQADADKEDAETQRSDVTSEINTMAECMDVDADLPEQGAAGILQHVEALRSRAAELMSLQTDRKEQLRALCVEAAGLFADVGIDVESEFASPGEKLTTSRVHAFENRIAELKADKEARRAKIDPMCQEIQAIWAVIGYTGDGELDEAISGGAEATSFSDASITKITECLESWRTNKAEREKHIREIGEQITELWEKLNTPDSEQEAFLKSDNSISDSVISACASYLSAKKQEFQARLEELVTGLRETIVALWDEIECGETEREEFAAYKADGEGVDEACWEAHKAYLGTLEARAEKMRPILSVFAKRQAILADKDEYERIIADPTRLTSRRGGAARLREEKLERRIKRDLPKVTAKLRAITEAWEAETGESFTVGGTRLLELLDDEEADEEARKQAKRDARKGKAASSRESAASARAEPRIAARRASAAPSSAAASSSSSITSSSSSCGRSVSRSSVGSHGSSRSQSRSSRATAGVPAASAAAAPAQPKRKPLAKSSGAANIQVATADKQLGGSRIPGVRHAGAKGKTMSVDVKLADEAEVSGPALDPITPSAVKVAGEAKAAASAMAAALAADE